LAGKTVVNPNFKVMLNSQKIGNEFYQNLGKLFYAVAMADDNVRPVETKRLRKFVRQKWLEVDNFEDEFDTDAAYQIEIVFDWLEAEEKEAQEYFEEFKEFYKDHPEKFTPELKQLIVDTAESIASSFAGTNRSEMMTIFNLKLLLKA
jgi:oligoendopeptidase F